MKPGMAAEAGARMMAGKALETSPFLPAPRAIIIMIMGRVGASSFRRKGSNSTQGMPSPSQSAWWKLNCTQRKGASRFALWG
jgi:hypothetical protein